MQIYPQSNVKKEINFCFKETLKEIVNHFKTKQPKLSFSFNTIYLEKKSVIFTKQF
jgi:hypothetical protein